MCACFSSKGALCVRCMDKFVRVENCPPRRNAPVEALGVLLGESPPWPNERPGVEDAGEREGSIERVRQWRCCAFRSPPFSERNPPGEGRIVTRGVHHAQHRLLDVEVMMLVIMALRALTSPVQHGRVPRKGRLGAAGLSSRHSWLHGYLLLLAPRRPRL